MADIKKINNGDTGLLARTNINEAIEKVNKTGLFKVAPDEYTYGFRLQTQDTDEYGNYQPKIGSNSIQLSYLEDDHSDETAGDYSFTNGYNNRALGFADTVTGSQNKSDAGMGFTGGTESENNGRCTIVHGDNLISNFPNQAVFGEYNYNEKDNILELGNGDSRGTGNAFSIDKEGRMRFNRTSAPVSPTRGQLYYDGATNKLRFYDGTTWHDLW